MTDTTMAFLTQIGDLYDKTRTDSDTTMVTTFNSSTGYAARRPSTDHSSQRVHEPVSEDGN